MQNAVANHTWERVEATERRARKTGPLRVVTGAIFLPLEEGGGKALKEGGRVKVIVPDYFYKILVKVTPEGKLLTLSLWMKNATDAKPEVTNIENISAKTGFRYFGLDVNGENYINAETISEFMPF